MKQKKINQHLGRSILLTICCGAFFFISASFVFAERLAVDTPVANIRSGPGTKYDVLWKVERYHPLEIIKKDGQWYSFRDFEGDEGWVHKSLVKKLRTVITIKEKCNMRSGPGTKNKIIFKAEKGIPFKVIKQKGQWLNVEHGDGDKGWLHKSLVW